jgi:hypothetical protein
MNFGGLVLIARGRNLNRPIVSAQRHAGEAGVSMLADEGPVLSFRDPLLETRQPDRRDPYGASGALLVA